MSWQAILGVKEQSGEAPIHSQNSQNRPSMVPAAYSANSANIFAPTENFADSSPSPAALPVETDFEERAAIVEYQAGVPREWAEGYARLLCLPPPAGIKPERWQQIVDDGGRFLDEWADQAHRLGWTTQEVFGISPVAPEHRFDMRGLVPSLHGHPIVLLTAEAATVDAGGQSRLRIFRRSEGRAVLLWKLAGR